MVFVKIRQGFLWFLLKLSTLFLNKLQFFWEFYPLVFAGYFDGAAFELTEDVGRVVGDGELGIEVFGTVVVDHLKIGLLAVFADIDTGDNPYAGVGGLLQVSERIAEYILPWNGNSLFIQVQAQEDIIFLIGNDALERPVRLLLRRSGANENQNENENAYATKNRLRTKTKTKTKTFHVNNLKLET